MMKMRIKTKKEPTLLRKLIDIHHEQAMRHKAIRLLEKQSWSLDFLSLMLVKAGRVLGDGIDLEIIDKNGVHLKLTYNKAVENVQHSPVDMSEDIFNKLDDDAAVEDFILRHNVR